ncbi:hypothetical protein L914_13502 [Phytophthora nicotianae]|uniref:HTH CENPB-type domain-containing protein n=1 Tax=Phytophthora nicotianae TaxID=4792 RepID=W2MYR5_PHYNI|nr:hypothetical protein L914_13502 [Phytophthora nicotianae]
MAEHGARRRIVGGGRRPLLGAVEDTLVDLIYEKRIRKEKVSRSWIALMALELFHQSRTEEKHEEDPIRFVASDPWINNFMSRNNLPLRERTNLMTLTDDVLIERAVAYMQFLEEHKPHKSRAYHSDGRDCNPRVCFHVMRITVMAVTATGKKLPPCLIWKRKNRGSIERLGGCYIAYQPRAWVDQDLLLNWLDWYYPTVLQRTDQYVVWDSMRAHIENRVKQRCNEKAIKIAVVPGGICKRDMWTFTSPSRTTSLS